MSTKALKINVRQYIEGVETEHGTGPDTIVTETGKVYVVESRLDLGDCKEWIVKPVFFVEKVK